MRNIFPFEWFLIISYTTFEWQTNCKMPGVILAQKSDNVRVHWWYWSLPGGFCADMFSQYIVQSWQSMNAWKSDDMCRTEALDCSAKPANITCMCSAMCVLASNGMGWHRNVALLWNKALCCKDPSNSHESERMWATQSINSFWLSNKSKFTSYYNIFNRS